MFAFGDSLNSRAHTIRRCIDFVHVSRPLCNLRLKAVCGGVIGTGLGVRVFGWFDRSGPFCFVGLCHYRWHLLSLLGAGVCVVPACHASIHVVLVVFGFVSAAEVLPFDRKSGVPGAVSGYTCITLGRFGNYRFAWDSFGSNRSAVCYGRRVFILLWGLDRYRRRRRSPP